MGSTLRLHGKRTEKHRRQVFAYIFFIFSKYVNTFTEGNEAQKEN